MVGGSMLVLVPFSQRYDTKRIEKHFSEYPEITSPSMGNSWADNTDSQSLTAEQ